MNVACDFYGSSLARDRLELISNVTEYLRNSGMPIESIKSSVKGEFLVNFERNVLRAFDFCESVGVNPAEPEQFRQMIFLSKKI